MPEYEKNLVNLIKDVRKDLKVPNLPVVIGVLTGPWVKAEGHWAAIRKAQADAAKTWLLASRGRFVSLAFRMKSGAVRTMLCRTGVTKGVNRVGLKFDPSDRDLLGVYDMLYRGFRFINLRKVMVLWTKKQRLCVQGEEWDQLEKTTAALLRKRSWRPEDTNAPTVRRKSLSLPVTS